MGIIIKVKIFRIHTPDRDYAAANDIYCAMCFAAVFMIVVFFLCFSITVFVKCFVAAYMSNKVVCDVLLRRCVVSGLDEFVVGVSEEFPTQGSPVDTSSYTLCGQYSGPVTVSQTITVACASFSQLYRYVVIQSSDATAESLCIAEVAVYAGRQCTITLILIQQ